MSRIVSSQASKVFQQLIQELKLQTATYKHPIITNYFQSKFEPLSIEKESELSTSDVKLYKEADEISVFLEHRRKHKHLIDLYAPVVGEEERVTASAKRVGLQLPKMFDGLDIDTGDVKKE
ncbi:hypothetical protein K502DRAFT_315427 [Neoconidiobolus thromboides FSU 785]|nr:hypothetical protein K502DRAFT_315427 [Neoconidiobolus thromboides FSU 785]